MKKRNYGIAFLVLAVLTAVFLAANLCVGSVNIPLSQVISVLGGRGKEPVFRDIVMKLRFPRALAAAILGGGLALSGYLLQTFFHNPVAGPFILGISSGAKMTVALFMVFSLKMMIQPGSALMILSAFAGAMLSMGFVILLSQAVDRMSMLIVGGVMIGYICSAVTDFVVTFADDSDIVNLHNWSKGSFSGIGWEQVQVMAAVILVVFAWVFFMSKQISAHQMGEAYAKSLGLNVKSFRAALV